LVQQSNVQECREATRCHVLSHFGNNLTAASRCMSLLPFVFGQNVALRDKISPFTANV
jgi:hypothetical protein